MFANSPPIIICPAKINVKKCKNENSRGRYQTLGKLLSKVVSVWIKPATTGTGCQTKIS